MDICFCCQNKSLPYLNAIFFIIIYIALNFNKNLTQLYRLDWNIGRSVSKIKILSLNH